MNCKMADVIRQEIGSEYRKLFVLAEEFKRKLFYEKKRLPYHINVIDELHINENGHSRILMQLIKFQNAKGEYEILESLIRYIKQQNRSSEFESIVLDKPRITQEESRIDLWVRDKGYAIIFENKVYNAPDQKTQLARYIDKTKDSGYREETIFIVYLSQFNNGPTVQSWGNYEETFKRRYANLSFRSDILPWLKNHVLPNIRYKDILLHSAILQYIDYLEGLFNSRTIENQMNMNLDNFIVSQLELKGKTEKECISILHEKISDFEEITSKMQSLVETYIQNIIKKWKERTKNSFPNLNPNSSEDAYTDVTFNLSDGKDVFIYIGEENNRLYCQVEFCQNVPDEEATITGTPIMELLDLLPERDEKNDFCIYKYENSWDGNFDAVYKLFVDVVEKAKVIFQNK